MTKTTLLIGGNSGDMNENLTKAKKLITKELGEIIKQSSILQSKAWGFDADDFLNQVIVINTELDPKSMLLKIWEIEKLFGRERGTEAEELIKYNERKAGSITYISRAMDIDILYYGNKTIKTDLLTIPHPLINEREFTLKLLHECKCDEHSN